MAIKCGKASLLIAIGSYTTYLLSYLLIIISMTGILILNFIRKYNAYNYKYVESHICI